MRKRERERERGGGESVREGGKQGGREREGGEGERRRDGKESELNTISSTTPSHTSNDWLVLVYLCHQDRTH